MSEQPAEPARTETERLDPLPDGPIELSTGLRVCLVPLKTRQLFRLLRILTHGAGAAVLTTGLDFNADEGEFTQRLVGITILAIPDAESEACEFVASMVEPADLVKKPASQLTKDQLAENKRLWDRVNEDLFNPDPGDLIDIVARIIQAESRDLQALGKKIRQLLEMARRTGKTETAPAQAADPLQSPASSEPIPPPLMPSSQSTDGQTSESSTSPSGDSGRSEPPSVLAGTPAPASAAS
jgi:hypothetical protein